MSLNNMEENYEERFEGLRYWEVFEVCQPEKAQTSKNSPKSGTFQDWFFRGQFLLIFNFMPM